MTTARRLDRRIRDDGGSTLLITIFLSMLAIMIVFVVVAASSLYLERKRLFTLADGAALSGAEAWSLDQVSLDGDALDLELDSQAVHRAVASYLSDAGAPAATVELVEAASRDGRSATVTLRTEWHAPISTDLLPIAVPIEVTTTARSVFH
ncbi:pilus assembly protein TadG-related protein [Agromyces salentinus]|uniref:Putative Flp pilus-assembly TadG-like N-terminal domain-containing protein n=1 Tax=Agromyces salentinus TaxID=269421 RepID=A0ABN2MNE3_9MICO|nr:pilus assembly protein TadG-related protein [Agromyces salentinus]